MTSKIWRIQTHYSMFPIFTTVPDEHSNMTWWFAGQPMPSNLALSPIWLQPNLSILEECQYRGVPFEFRIGDFYDLHGGVLTCNERAMRALLPIIEDDVQILTVSTLQYELFPEIPSVLYVLNPIKVIDCVEREKDKISKSTLSKHTYKRSCIGDVSIFKTPESLVKNIMVEEKFKVCVEKIILMV
jgi:hypothetical protein